MPGRFVVGDVFGKRLKVPQLPEVQCVQEIWVWRLAELAPHHGPCVLERLEVVASERQFLEVVEVVQDLCTVPSRVVLEYYREQNSSSLHRVVVQRCGAGESQMSAEFALGDAGQRGRQFPIERDPSNT